MKNITKKQYDFQFDIHNSPVYPDIEIVLSFIKQYKELNNIKYIETKFVMSHFNGGIEIPELEKEIKLISDGQGIASYPRGLNIEYITVDGEIVPNVIIENNDYTLLSDIEFYLHWMKSNKSEKALFDLIVIMHDSRNYDALGNVVGNGTGTHTFFDLKYSGVFYAEGLNKLL